MRIGIYDPYLDTLTGGEKYMLTMASCLAKQHDVSLFWNPQDQEKISNQALKKLAIDLNNISFVENIFSKNVSLLSRLQKTREFDAIIFLSDGSMPIVSSKLFLHFQFPVEWVNGKSLLTKLKLMRVKKIICNSMFTKSFIDNTFGVNSTVLYPPVDIKKLESKEKEEKENSILHVGRFGVSVEGENYKKQDVMIEVFKNMIKKGVTGWKFVIVISVRKEDKDKLVDLQEKAKGYPIEFIENPPNETLWDYYAKAKIYWHASGFGEDILRHPERAEHFGITTVEAMSMGAVPVVISMGGQKEIVETEKNGFLWNTKEELGELTMMIMKDPTQLLSLSAAAKEKAKDFGKGRFCTELKEIILG